jgi:hypothetical protein
VRGLQALEQGARIAAFLGDLGCDPTYLSHVVVRFSHTTSLFQAEQTRRCSE